MLFPLFAWLIDRARGFVGKTSMRLAYSKWKTAEKYNERRGILEVQYLKT